MSDKIPFFSVCVPAVNRGRTIYTTLQSVVLQTFRDFELIVVNCGSTDNTDEEIQRFFKSDCFATNKCKYIYQQNNTFPKGIEDWNAPIELASGKYIAMLEGDDQYTSDYLQIAHQILYADSSIGLFGASNQCATRRVIGKINGEKLARDAYSGYHIPPPSEAIFIRMNKDDCPYKYNVDDFEYAGEIDLYIRLGLDGYNAYFIDQALIVRDTTMTDRNINTWHFYHDGFKCLKIYRDCFPFWFSLSASIYHIADVLRDLYVLGGMQKVYYYLSYILTYVNLFEYLLAFVKVSMLFFVHKLRKFIKK